MLFNKFEKERHIQVDLVVSQKNDYSTNGFV